MTDKTAANIQTMKPVQLSKSVVCSISPVGRLCDSSGLEEVKHLVLIASTRIAYPKMYAGIRSRRNFILSIL